MENATELAAYWRRMAQWLRSQAAECDAKARLLEREATTTPAESEPVEPKVWYGCI